MSAGNAGFIGTLLQGKYRVDSVLGEGGMGIVYRGTDTASAQPVAIKTLQPSAFDSKKARERFQREATLANRLNHSGIARVLAFGIEDETPYLIMELVEGVELTELIEKEGPQRPARAIDIMRQLVAALGEAHANKMVHRDIKPANMKLLNYVPGGPIVLKVLDFGLAKELDQEQGRLTSTGAVMGTPLYLAPEQAMDTTQIIDGRADQYSAGILFYELLAGYVPFQNQSVAGLLMSHVARTPPPLPKEIPEPLRRIVMRMLSKSPADRFPDDAALDQALLACEKVCASASAAARSSGPPEAVESFALARTSKLGQHSVKIGGGVGIFVILGLTLMLVKAQRHVAPTNSLPIAPLADTITDTLAIPRLAMPPPSLALDGGTATAPATAPIGAKNEALAPNSARRPASGKVGAGKKGASRKSAPNVEAPPQHDPFAVPVAR